MDRFAEVADQYDPHAVEERVFEYWDEVDAYEKTKEHRSDGEEFFFVDGPPYTSGAAHMGTTWNKTLKDAYIRFHRMCGFDVTDRPGYDMHGLPIETRVEGKLGFENKKDIEAFGEQAFIEECKAYAEEQLEGLQADFQLFGVWMDWENPYKTVDPTYMEGAWWAFQRAHERGLVEQGERSITQCPRCETAIAKNEVEFETVEDPSIYVKFPVRDRDGYLVVWTTTPWTIPANTFVAVGEELTYQAVRAEKEREREAHGASDGSSGERSEPRDSEVLYVAESCVEGTLKAGRYDDYEVLDEFSGAEMVGWEYDHPFGDSVDHPGGDGAFEVYTAEYVEADRTGLVHSAPGHGEEDFERGTELGLPTFCPVGGDGTFDERAGPYAGEFVRDANAAIIADLEAAGLMLASETVEHDYGHCWRCDTGIVQIVTDQWFITITDIKEELLDNIEDSEWHPEWARDNRFRDFVEDAPDWNVSRQRYWGIPIPIWTPSADSSASGGGDSEALRASDRSSGRSPREEAADGWDGDMDDAIVVGTREELAERVDQDVEPESVDLHKGTVDDLTITENGTTYTRVPDVFDVWLDSSVATWGTLDYPEQEAAFEELWPADLIMEAHDQTRGWFWSQLGMASAALGEIPYEEVLMHGFALMPDGRAMSKSKDILVDPKEVIEEHGTDPMRLFLLSVSAQGEDMRFSYEETAEMARRLNILWNVFRFPLPYMRMDGFEPALPGFASDGEAQSASERSSGDEPRDGGTEGTSVEDAALELEDEWVLSRLQAVKETMAEAWEDFEHDKAVDALLSFVVDDLSRYYVQLVRERMWEEEDSASKEAAYATTHRVLVEVVALLAPYAPFVTETLYQHLTGDDGFDTVHMCDWPTPDERHRQPALEDAVETVRAVEEAGSNARQQAGRKLRWPVQRVVVDAADDRVADHVRERTALVADRLNARDVVVVEPGDEWGELSYTARADMSELGPAFGDDATEVMNALNESELPEPSLPALRDAVADRLGRELELTADMVEFERETPDDTAGAEFDGGVVYVDATLTDDIESEGYAREIIRRVQEMRKEMDLDVDRRIRLDVLVFDDRVAELVARREDLIAEEVRAAELGAIEDGYREEWDVEGVHVELAIRPLPEAAA